MPSPGQRVCNRTGLTKGEGKCATEKEKGGRGGFQGVTEEAYPAVYFPGSYRLLQVLLPKMSSSESRFHMHFLGHRQVTLLLLCREAHAVPLNPAVSVHDACGITSSSMTHNASKGVIEQETAVSAHAKTKTLLPSHAQGITPSTDMPTPLVFSRSPP